MNIRNMRQQCQDLGISWEEIQLEAQAIVDVDRESNRYDHELRREVYYRVCCRGKQHMPFWKSLGQWNNPMYNGAFGGGNDWTVIPRWDEIADELSERFPQLLADDRPAETLYRFILSPFRENMTLREACEQVLNQRLEMLQEQGIDIDERMGQTVRLTPF